MSQAKVDRYKKEKANRKKEMARQKRTRMIAMVCTCVIAVALVGWAGYAGYNYYEENKPSQTYYADTTALTDYLNALDTESE